MNQQIQFSFFQFIIFIHEVKWLVFIFVLLLLPANSYATTGGTTDGPPPAKKQGPEIDPRVGIVFMCLLTAFFITCLLTVYFRHCAERQFALAAASSVSGSEIGSMRTVAMARGLDPAVIATFPSFSYSNVKELRVGQPVLECAVCINEFQDHESLRLLPKCSHVFHRECIDQWLALHVTCPVCRVNLVPRPGELSHTTEPCHDSNESPADHFSTQNQVVGESKNDLLPKATGLARSHSTGHSLVVENFEKFTLRLPDEVRSLFINLGISPQTSSQARFPTESSPRKSFKSVSVGTSRGLDYMNYERFDPDKEPGELNFRVMRPFIPPSGYGQVNVAGGNDSIASPGGFFRSMKPRLDRLFTGSKKDHTIGESSRDRLTQDNEV